MCIRDRSCCVGRRVAWRRLAGRSDQRNLAGPKWSARVAFAVACLVPFNAPRHGLCGAGGRASGSVWTRALRPGAGSAALVVGKREHTGGTLVGDRASAALRRCGGGACLVVAGALRAVAAPANSGADAQQTFICAASRTSQK